MKLIVFSAALIAAAQAYYGDKLSSLREMQEMFSKKTGQPQPVVAQHMVYEEMVETAQDEILAEDSASDYESDYGSSSESESSESESDSEEEPTDQGVDMSHIYDPIIVDPEVITETPQYELVCDAWGC